MATKTTTSNRILAIDLIRGYLILVIAAIHLGYRPSIIGLFSGRGQLWVSEADGFFLISGLLVGIIRHRDIIRSGFTVASKKLYARAWKLYLTCAILSFVYLVIGRWVTQAGWQGAKGGLDTIDPLWRVAVSILTLRYTYGWIDFLVYYAVFMALAPLALHFLARQRWWVVVAVSTALWLWQWAGTQDSILQGFLIWQMPFFLGVTIGYNWTPIHDWFYRLSKPTRRHITHGLIISAVLIYVAGVLTVIVPWDFANIAPSTPIIGPLVHFLAPISQNHWFDRMLLNQRRGLLRPIMLLLFTSGSYIIVRRFEPWIMDKLGWLLLPSGQNSLYAYIIESGLVFMVPIIIPQSNFLVNSAIEIIIILLTWWAIQKKFLFSIIPR